MQAPLRILHLEDDARDAELLLATLEAAGIVSQVTRVDSQADFLASLEQGGCDLILADYSLPSFDGLSALKIALEKCPDVPFIFVSGTLGEEVAVEALKIGAADYVLKERLSRLALSVQRALREAQARAGHKRAEGALRESEERFRALVTASSDALYRMSADWSEMINLRGMDFISDTLQPNRNWLAEYIPQDEQPRVTAAIKEAIRAKGVFELEHRVFLADGTIGWTSSRAVPMLDDVGEITEWFGAADDITERRRAEEALRESERRYRYIFQAAGVSIWEEDFSQIKAAIDELKAQGVRDFRQYLAEHPEFIWRVIQMVKVIDVNDVTVKLFRARSKEELLVSLDKVLGLIPVPEAEKVFAGQLIAIAEGQTSFVFENSAQTLDGDKLTVLFTITFPSQPSRLDNVLVSIMDITERKRAEEALRERADLLDLTHDTIFVRDMNDVITYWNHGAAELYGWTSEAAIGQVSHRLTQTIFPAPLEEINKQLLDTGRWEGELIHAKRDGSRVVVASRWSLQRDEHGNPVAILETNNDITERRRSERRYRHIFQAVGVSIWEEDFSQVKAAINELKTQGVRDFRRYLVAHPEFVRQAIPMVKVIDVNDATVKLFAAESKDELLVSLDKIFLPETEGVFAGELIALAEGRTSFESETILQTLKGDKLTVLFTLTFPPQPANLDSVLVTITDITERKRAEEALQKAQAELAHATRVTTMGELASSIAHEVNQPLAAVVTNGNAALRWLAADPPNLDEVRESVGRIVRDGHRASEVVGHVRALFRKAATAKERLDINGLIQDVLALVPGELRRNRVQLRTELAYDLPQVVADRVQLQQVLLNLIINAVEAMSVITEHPRQLLIRSQRADADGVLVSVEDSGVGMGAQNPAQIFDAFFTTKPEGLGMGLSISRTTIEAHGGRLWATANEGYGATFQFTLPMNGGNA